MSRIVTLDIETIGPPVGQAELEEWRDNWKPPKNMVNLEPIMNKKAKDEKKFLEKGALNIGRAQMIAVGMYDSNTETTEVWCGENPKEGVEFIAAVIDGGAADYKLVTFNGKAFDMPIVIRTMGEYDIRFKQPYGRWDHIDLKKELGAGTFKQWCSNLKIMEYDMDGSDIAALYEEDDWDKIYEYTTDDALNLWKVFYKYTAAVKL